jgi:hypothetical protein
LLSGQLTADLKGGWLGARVGKIEASLPYHMYNVGATDKKVLKYTKRKLMISATTLPNLKFFDKHNIQLSEVRLEVYEFSWTTLYYIKETYIYT